MLDFKSLKDLLPLADASFVSLRSTKKIYVDKTEYIYNLARNSQPRILTRPRRFGKSTLLSTLKELFEHGVKPYDGHDSYFKGLAIEKLWKDKAKYHIIHLDLFSINDECTTVDEFRQNLNNCLESFAQQFGVILPVDADKPSKKLKALVSNLSDQSVALLIDEYDAPLLSHIGNKEEESEVSLILKGIFSAVKIYSQKFRCVFATGITRYQDLGLGTAGNSFTDITNDPDFGACCGYTREELKQYFADNLRYAASIKAGCSDNEVTEEQIDSLLDSMAQWYDGFCFDDVASSKVFSTWSVLRFFTDPLSRLLPYWSAEEGLGLPQLLKVSLRKINIQSLLEEVASGNIRVDYFKFIQSSLINPEANPYALLFQTGYLTLSQPFIIGDEVYLDTPNREISIAFANLVAVRLFGDNLRFTTKYSVETERILVSLDPNKIQDHFNALFASIPYEHYPVQGESMVVALIYFYLLGAGLQPRCEESESKGRPDAIIDLKEHGITIVFEYKYVEDSDPKILDAKLYEAEEQVKSRDYGHNIKSEKKIARFALVFCGAQSERKIARMSLVDLIEK